MEVAGYESEAIRRGGKGSVSVFDEVESEAKLLKWLSLLFEEVSSVKEGLEPAPAMSLGFLS